MLRAATTAMVPATTINRTISSIPLLGDILVGKKVGEGAYGIVWKARNRGKVLSIENFLLSAKFV